MSEQKKQYTFVNMKRCTGSTGKEYIGVTIELLCKKPEFKTVAARSTGEAKTVASFRAPVNNRSDYIEKMCGLKPYTTDDGTAWARITMWERTAERLQNYLAKNPDGAVLIVTGSIKVADSEGKDGKTYRNLDILADDFNVIRTLTKKGGASAPSGSAPAARPASAALSEDEDDEALFDGGFLDIDDANDDDLPF